MAYKITVIGGGSVLWMPRLGCDILMEPSLEGSELVLVDIDPAAAKLCQEYLQACAAQLKVNWTISIDNEDNALKGADCVVVSISTGGFEAMDKDYTIPEQFGVYHSVSDTTGPGGIFRTLRNAPVFIKLAEKMSKLCPNAWMLHVTNPLSQITRIVNATGLVRCCGLCHEVAIARNNLRRIFDCPDLDMNVVGVNHFTLFTKFYSNILKDPMAEMNLANYLKHCHRQSKTSGSVDDLVSKGTVHEMPLYFNFYLKEIIGCYPAAGSAHIGENFPRFYNDPAIIEKCKLWRKGVLPRRPENKREMTATLRKTLDEKTVPPETSERSFEMLCDCLVGLLTGEERRMVATLPNIGQISNLPKDASVETFAMVTRDAITPVMSGEIPMSCYGFMASVLAEQELTCAAAMKRDRQLVRQALFASPLFHFKEQTDELMNALFEAEKEWIDW